VGAGGKDGGPGIVEMDKPHNRTDSRRLMRLGILEASIRTRGRLTLFRGVSGEGGTEYCEAIENILG